jgi:anti-sigma factor RsiW
LDVLEEQPVAALIYQRRKHFINLFIWPSARTVSAREKSLAQRGYNLVHWTEGGMDYWAVSDVNRGDLQEFTQAVRRVKP